MKTKKASMTWGDTVAGIAQGVINIAEGYTTIEIDSRVYNAMVSFVEKFSAIENGHGKLPPQWKAAAAHLAGYSKE